MGPRLLPTVQGWIAHHAVTAVPLPSRPQLMSVTTVGQFARVAELADKDNQLKKVVG